MIERVTDLLRHRYRELPKWDGSHQEREAIDRLRPRTGQITVAPRCLGLLPFEHYTNSARADETRRAHDNDPVREAAVALHSTDAYDVAVDTAATAVRGLRPALHALEEIALLQDTAPVAAAVAVRGLQEIRAELCPPVLVPVDGWDRALGEGRC